MKATGPVAKDAPASLVFGAFVSPPPMKPGTMPPRWAPSLYHRADPDDWRDFPVATRVQFKPPPVPIHLAPKALYAGVKSPPAERPPLKKQRVIKLPAAPRYPPPPPPGSSSSSSVASGDLRTPEAIVKAIGGSSMAAVNAYSGSEQVNKCLRDLRMAEIVPDKRLDEATLTMEDHIDIRRCLARCAMAPSFRRG